MLPLLYFRAMIPVKYLMICIYCYVGVLKIEAFMQTVNCNCIVEMCIGIAQ